MQVHFALLDPPTDIPGDSANAPVTVAPPVLRCWPNPFLEATFLMPATPSSETRAITIYDISGRLLRRLKAPPPRGRSMGRPGLGWTPPALRCVLRAARPRGECRPCEARPAEVRRPLIHPRQSGRQHRVRCERPSSEEEGLSFCVARSTRTRGGRASGGLADPTSGPARTVEHDIRYHVRDSASTEQSHDIHHAKL